MNKQKINKLNRYSRKGAKQGKCLRGTNYYIKNKSYTRM